MNTKPNYFNRIDGWRFSADSDHSAQIDLARHYMRVEPIFPRSLLVERPEHSALGDFKCWRFDGAGEHRSVARSVDFGTWHGDAQLPCPDFQILIAFDIADVHLARGEPRPEIRTPRYLDH